MDWSQVTPDDFEQLVYQLLECLGFSNRQWFRGPGDRGRDLQATTLDSGPLPGRERLKRWVIECKRYTRALTPSDLDASVAWLRASPPDAFLIATTSWLSVATKDWLEGVKAGTPTELHFLEGHDLEELMTRHEPPKYRELVEAQIGLPLPPHQAALHRISAAMLAIPSPDPAQLRQRLGPQPDSLPPGVPAVSLRELHDVRYVAPGLSETTYTLTIAALGATDLTHDSFRLYADIPIHDNRTLALQASVGTTQLDDVRFRFDSGGLKLIDFYFPESVEPLTTLTYTFSFLWPVPEPLVGTRYYSTYGRRPKAEVEVRITVPENYALADVLPLALRDGMSRRIQPHAYPTASAEETIVVRYGPLRYREQLLTTFSVRER